MRHPRNDFEVLVEWVRVVKGFREWDDVHLVIDQILVGPFPLLKL